MQATLSYTKLVHALVGAELHVERHVDGFIFRSGLLYSCLINQRCSSWRWGLCFFTAMCSFALPLFASLKCLSVVGQFSQHPLLLWQSLRPYFSCQFTPRRAGSQLAFLNRRPQPESPGASRSARQRRPGKVWTGLQVPGAPAAKCTLSCWHNRVTNDWVKQKDHWRKLPSLFAAWCFESVSVLADGPTLPGCFAVETELQTEEVPLSDLPLSLSLLLFVVSLTQSCWVHIKWSKVRFGHGLLHVWVHVWTLVRSPKKCQPPGTIYVSWTKDRKWTSGISFWTRWCF